jgi:hypothetical protein
MFAQEGFNVPGRVENSHDQYNFALRPVGDHVFPGREEKQSPVFRQIFPPVPRAWKFGISLMRFSCDAGGISLEV